MKSLMKRLCRLFAFLLMTLSLGSCGEVELGIGIDGGPGYYETTDYLCSRTWTDEWTDEYGTYYYQELDFYPDHRGVDYLYTEDRYGNRRESALNFRWEWQSYSYTDLRMDYGNGSSYMERISMGGNRLECLLDGSPVCFTGK